MIAAQPVLNRHRMHAAGNIVFPARSRDAHASAARSGTAS